MQTDEKIAALENRIRVLEAKEGIRDTIARYARAVDKKDWGELETIYTEDAALENLWRNTTYTGKEAIVNFFREHRQTFKFTRRMSNVNERIEIHGNQGVATTQALALIGYSGDSYVLFGDYEWHMRLEKGMWRIFKFVIYPSIMTTLEKGWGGEQELSQSPPPLRKAE